MRILILSTSDNTGGAAIAARRLLHALVDAGHEARMLVRDRTTDDALVETVDGRWTKAIDRARVWVANGFTRRRLWYTDAAWWGCKVTKHRLFAWADVVHLHYVNQGFVSLSELDKILHSGKRIVWTMHDMWSSTSICHHAEDCVRYTDRCHHCEQLCRPSERDLAARVFERKRRMYADVDITFVACSEWLAAQARRSALLKGKRVVSIPNTIDTELFVPRARAATERQRILFASANVGDERKGMGYLLQALSVLGDVDLELVVLGQNSHAIMSVHERHCITAVPYLSDAREVAMLNASVDVFVTPSLQENLPNTIMEAMACGVPCVGFDVGGIPEMIDHKRNGYVARLRDADDLAEGIRQALAHRDEWGEAARQKVLASYSNSVVEELYLRVYR